MLLCEGGFGSGSGGNVHGSLYLERDQDLERGVKIFYLLVPPPLLLYLRIFLITVSPEPTNHRCFVCGCSCAVFTHCKLRRAEMMNRGASSSSCVLCLVVPSSHTVGRAACFERVCKFAPWARILDFFSLCKNS